VHVLFLEVGLVVLLAWIEIAVATASSIQPEVPIGKRYWACCMR
jgi:hypothetical protein